MKQKNISPLEELWNFWMSVIRLSNDGKERKKLDSLLQILDVNSLIFHQSFHHQKMKIIEKFAIVEFLHKNKLMIWKDKLNSVKKNSLITKLLKILEALLIGKEKDLFPFWTEFSAKLSE